MAQPAKKKTIVTTEKEVEQTAETSTQNNTLNMEQLTALLASMQKQMNEQAEIIKKYQANEKAVNNEKTTTKFELGKKNFDKTPTESIKISNDEEITVTNNCDGELVLSTLGLGNGKCYAFHNIGYQIDIPYSDLKEIIHNNRSFIEGGRVYIENERVIKKHKLEKYYEHMLSADDFDKLKELEPKDFFDCLIQLPKADSNTLNKGNEPHQIDLVLDYVLNKCKNDEFPSYLLPQLEQAYSKIKGHKINIAETIDNYHEIFKNEG